MKMREKMFKFGMLISIVSTYNVNQLPASIINKPGVFQPEMVNYIQTEVRHLYPAQFRHLTLGFHWRQEI